MSRYVNAEAIKEKKWQAESEACFYALEDVVSVTDIDEEEDAIDIVRCKECKFWKNKHLCATWSAFGTIETDADDYCSYGERSE